MGKKRSSFFVIKVVFVAVILAALTRVFVFGVYKVPTSSMLPNLYVGDVISAYKFPFTAPGRILVKLLAGSDYAIGRGDVVIFKHPTNQSFYVKRVIGLPGDKIQISQGKLTINSVAALDIKISNPKDFQAHQYYQVYSQSISEDLTFSVMKRENQKDQASTDINTIVGKGEYFVLGDSRDSSEDSRDWGSIDYSSIEGLVTHVLVSVDWEGGGIESLRWNRFFKPIISSE